jgi:glycosyltransferase involved in cell wall biosynthesis
MKIALVTYGVSVHGGTQKQVLRLAEDLRRRGVSVQILVFEYDPKSGYQGFGGFSVETFTKSNVAGRLGRLLGDIYASWRLVSSIAKNTDVLNIHDHGCIWVQILAKLRRPRMKVVWQINDLHAAFRMGPSSDHKQRWTSFLHRWLCRFAAKLANHITVNVMKNKLRVDQCYQVNSTLMYPGVDALETKPIDRKFKTPLALLSVGVFFPYRNYESVLRSMVCLREQGVKSQLTLVGATCHSETYAEKIRTLACELEVQVLITGEIDDSRLGQIIRHSDIFLFPNLDQSWGLSVFEAMSSSLPVVVSKSAGAAELLTGRPGSRIVDALSPSEIASAVIEITKTQEDYNRLCREAFMTVSEMSWPKTYCQEAWHLFTELSA